MFEIIESCPTVFQLKAKGSGIYILQVKKLRQELADQGLNEKQSFYYYLASTLFGAILYEAVANGPASEFAAADVLDGVLYLTFTVVGIIYCYRQNGGATGTDFLKRMVSLGWVMFWRLVSLVLPFFVIVGAIQWFTTGQFGRPGAELPVLVVIMNGLFLGMFWRIGVHMKWIADRK